MAYHRWSQFRSKEDRFVAFTPEQMEALLQVLTVRDDDFRLNLINALAHIGDEKALKAVEELASNDREKKPVRKQARDILPGMRKRVGRRVEARVLRRAVTPEASTLLRAADPHPDLPNEQLMRPGS